MTALIHFLIFHPGRIREALPRTFLDGCKYNLDFHVCKAHRAVFPLNILVKLYSNCLLLLLLRNSVEPGDQTMQLTSDLPGYYTSWLSGLVFGLRFQYRYLLSSGAYFENQSSTIYITSMLECIKGSPLGSTLYLAFTKGPLAKECHMTV